MFERLPFFAALAFVCCIFSFNLNGQTIFQGKVIDQLSGRPIPGTTVSLLTTSTTSDADGAFKLEAVVGADEVVLTFSVAGYRTLNLSQKVNGQSVVELGSVNLDVEENQDLIGSEEIIPTVTLSTDEDISSGAQNISGVLTASRDVFISAAAYNLSTYRFNIRGYDSDYSQVLFNGVSMNDPESGSVFWSEWGGLNDVTRNRDNIIGLEAGEFAFGGIGGASNIDTRASNHRKQFRVSYALSNRAYRHRVMGTWSTGLLKNGWAVSLSASRRWAEEGYVPGTFYDAWSYFMSVDKKIGSKHLFNFTFLGAPSKRGRSGASTKEMYDLAGTNYYNSYWGYQNGEKRNSRVSQYNQPMAIMRHDWDISDNARLTTAASYQFGRAGTTALDWYNARDPRPDYYRRLPSYIQNEQSAEVEALLRANESLRQLDWDYMYDVNRHNLTTVENANGIEGNSVTGNRAQYVVEERRFDSKTANLNTILAIDVNEHFTINGGLNYQLYVSENFKVLDDLLGADFYVDIDKFSEFVPGASNDYIQNDLAIPNRILRQGDIFGYNYNINVRKGGGWLQGDFSFKHLDFFLAGSADKNTYWRDGKVQNGRFPDNSLGESEKADFFEYGAKSGITYKLDGRNYFFVNGGYISRAPMSRNAFLAQRTRNALVEDLTNEKILSFEGGYLLRAPYAKARLVGYYTDFKDQLFNRSLFLDSNLGDGAISEGGFVNYIMTGIDTRHMGLEIAGEIRAFSRLKISAVAALGQYTYTNRPLARIYLDNSAAKLAEKVIYLKNFYVPNGPQKAYTFGLNYSGKDFWFASLNFNFFDDIYMDFYPERRTLEAVSYVSNPDYTQQAVDPDSDLWKRIVYQEKAPSAYTLDFFGGKSWKIKDLYIYLNVGVNNILDKKDFITGGYEQFRFDFENKNPDLFPSRYFYSFGRNYFVSLAFRI
ncbi:MAG TPA: carboxypeptidase-like regulatory domain-containing protein [Flavilitoribacter sp.]|nr:carboxypeptidase-like regulatory domain-containing protein [Flavilitoribacter sp.]